MNLLSKSKAKYIKTLQVKKSRIQESKFIVEGAKSVVEFLKSGYSIDEVVGTEEFYNSIDHELLPELVSVCSAKLLSSLGSFKTNNAALAIVTIPERYHPGEMQDQVVLALDHINDPGNLGTIIRIADWYNIKHVLTSNTTVDVYNPKVVSASKGSLTRVKVMQLDLHDFLSSYVGEVYAADLYGKPLKELGNIRSGVVVMGSESHGVSKELEPFISQKITIPRIGGAESLNVAVATGIVCYELLTS